MPDVYVTCHAVERYLERVDGSIRHDEAEAAIRSHEHAIAVAAGFGCSCVRLGCGAALILDGLRVVTVLGRKHWPRHLLVGGHA